MGRSLRRLRAPGLVMGLAIAPLAGAAQTPTPPARVVPTAEGATNVMAIGLDRRETGEPVLVLQSGHTVALADDAWRGWISRLAGLAPVVAFDRPGTGASPYDGAPLTPDRMVLHTRAVLDALGVSPPYILVGHSWGAELIGRYAAARPEDVAGLVFLDPTPRAEPEFWRPWQAATDEADSASRHAEGDSLPPEPPPPGDEGLAAERAVVNRWVSDPPRDVPVVPDVAVPVAVLLAAPPPPPDPSGGFTPEFLRAFYDLKIEYFSEQLRERPDATLIVDTGIGHMVYVDDPDLALEAVRRVIRSSGGEAGR